MTHLDIIRAWKDLDYRLSLSEAERAQLPDNPVGLIELTDADLYGIAGGIRFADLYGIAGGIRFADLHIIAGGSGVSWLSGVSGTTCLGCTNAVKCC